MNLKKKKQHLHENSLQIGTCTCKLYRSREFRGYTKLGNAVLAANGRVFLANVASTSAAFCFCFPVPLCWARLSGVSVTVGVSCSSAFFTGGAEGKAGCAEGLLALRTVSRSLRAGR